MRKLLKIALGMWCLAGVLWAQNMVKIPDYSMSGEDSILFPEDCGLINGQITLNGWLEDIAAIRGIYAPPLFSDNFQFNLRFNGRRVHSNGNRWAPDKLTRTGTLGCWSLTTELVPVADSRAVILKVTAKNTSDKPSSLSFQLEATGGVKRAPLWGFMKPSRAGIAEKRWQNGIFSLFSDDGVLAIGSTLRLAPHGPLCSGVLDAAEAAVVRPNETLSFHICFALVSKGAEALVEDLLIDADGACRRSADAWHERVRKLYSVMPEFRSDNDAWVRLYDRSLLHLLLNEWNVPEFKLHPYYGTGGINGGCVGCYLWNYGEPYRLWSMLNPQSAREHIKTFLNLDLRSCYAFNPDDGSAFGPYYPVNHEKIIFLIHAYVLQTRDVAFLNESFNGKTILEHVVEQALANDDLSKDAVLVDYGDGNHHLELRRTLRYDGIAPDLNLRRIISMRLADELCKLAGVTPKVDLVKRAEALKALVKKELFDRENGWYLAIGPDGKKYLRYTMQMFKAMGWNHWALDAEDEDALIRHLMNTKEFLGECGLHSLSKLDPAYDEFDIDNGGPGACVSFTPAVIDRLYMSGKVQEAENLFRRLLWLGESLPYWGDSQRADIREYRRDTPLQNDIQGAAIAQSMIFGMFGINALADGSVEICPHLQEGMDYMELRDVRLAGLCFSVRCERASGVTVTCGDSLHKAPLDGKIMIKQ